MEPCEWCKTQPVKERGYRFCSRSCAAFGRHAMLRDRGHVYASKASSDDVERAVEVLNAGHTWGEAASVAGLTRDGLRSRAKRGGLATRAGHGVARSPERLCLPTEPHELGYLAAIIDGEGHISMDYGSESHRRRTVHVGVSNTSEDLMEWLAGIGGGVSWKARDSRYKRIAVWQVCARRDARSLLIAVEPHMKIKGERARQAIAVLNEWLSPPSSTVPQA